MVYINTKFCPRRPKFLGIPMPWNCGGMTRSMFINGAQFWICIDCGHQVPTTVNGYKLTNQPNSNPFTQSAKRRAICEFDAAFALAKQRRDHAVIIAVSSGEIEDWATVDKLSLEVDRLRNMKPEEHVEHP